METQLISRGYSPHQVQFTNYKISLYHKKKKKNFNNIASYYKMINLNMQTTTIKLVILSLIIINQYSLQTYSTINKGKNSPCEFSTIQYFDIIQPIVIQNKQHIKPTQIDEDHNISSKIKTKHFIGEKLSPITGCPDSLIISFFGLGDRFVINLSKNKHLISDRYFQHFSDLVSKSSPKKQHSFQHGIINEDRNQMFLNLHNFKTNQDHCHYHGIVNDNLNSISAISIVNNQLLNGFFQYNQKNYYLHANQTFSTILTSSPNLCNNNNNKLINYDTLSKSNNPVNYRSRRAIKRRRSSVGSSNKDNLIKHEPFQSNSSSLYVELLVVHDHSQYVEYNGNASNIAERTMQIVNIMNAFYKQLNIFIALVGVVLWTEKDEIQLTNDGDSTLTNFLKYRHEKLLPKYHHDNAQLITSTSFNGSVVGKALKGPICTHEHSGGVNTDHSHSPAIVAVTLAHELGHNLGMEHDEDDKCKCPDEKCIMSSSSSAVHPKHWSSCSIDYLEESRKHGLLDCLLKKPEKVFGPICGNGFVEEGEDCDLGVPLPSYGTSKSKQPNGIKCQGSQCDQNQAIFSNHCCDRKTCKFTTNSTCAQGPCCDLSRCSVYNGTEIKVCRQKRGECDFEEVCDGKSEYCPEDAHYHDGIECGPGLSLSTQEREDDFNRVRSYCYEGKCNSHLSQCNLLWGSSGSVSRDICYDQNVHGNTSGNCGYDRMAKVYNSCEQEDSICGMLHCVHDQGDFVASKKTGKLQYGFDSASILTVSFFVMSNHAKIYCHGAIIDSGPNVKDPGLVPDGASCGQEKMCLNQKCVPTSDILYKNWCPSDCNGNGICDNLGICHCFDGTIGTSCYQFFGSNFHLSLLLYIIIFFVPLVALFLLALNHYKKELKIWWFLHNRKIELKNKYRNQNQTGNSRLGAFVCAPDVGTAGRKPIISDPIPLNQHNVNRPFYEQTLHLNNVDPWAETTDVGQNKQ